MSVLLVLGLFVVLATAHNITHLEVPRYGDPRHGASLACHYINDKGDPPLHSVKWYKGKDEIFRFTPEQEPVTRTFNSSTGVSKSSCNKHSCSIAVSLPKTYNTRISFTCEVSTEGPRFAVVKETKNLTVAVILKEDPVISELPSSVQFGEDVELNCTTSPAMPPANIVWYIDGKPERTEPWVMNNTHVSAANEFGHRSSWRGLKLKVASSRSAIDLRCEATQPTWPLYVRTANATLLVAKSPHLSMFTASGTSARGVESTLVSVACALIHIFSKYSAFCELDIVLH